MDVAAIKKAYVEATSAANKSKDAVGEDLMGRFSEAVAARINNVSAHAGAGQGKNALVDSVGNTASQPSDPRPAETSAPAPRSDNEDAPQARHSDDVQPRERAETAEPRHEDTRSDDALARDGGRDTASGDDRGHESHQDAGASAQSSHNDDASAPETAQQDAPQSAGSDGEAQAATTSQTATGEGKADPVLAAVQQMTTDGQTKTATGENVVKTAAVQAAGAEGQTKQSNQNGQKAQDVQASGPAIEGEAGEDGLDIAAKAKDGKGKGTAQAQTALNTNGKANANAEAAVEKGPSVVQQQASDLSKKVGPDQNLKVNVNVTEESEELVSKPTANLMGQAATKKDGESLTPTGVQNAAKGQSQHGAPLNPNANGGQNGTDPQAQGQQNPLADAKAEAAKAAANTQARAAEAKAINGVANSGATAAKVGGGEAAPAPQAAAQTGNTQQTQHTQETAKPQQTPQQAQTRAQVTEQVNVQITKAVNDGLDKIRIQLKPAHLGRVEVQLDIAQDGKVTAVISADNKDTLDMLKQDSRELERALREAGLDVGGNDLSFNMRGEGRQGGEDGDGQKVAKSIVEPTLEELLETQPVRRDIISDDRVDITA